jgi:hypothetical protein
MANVENQTPSVAETNLPIPAGQPPVTKEPSPWEKVGNRTQKRAIIGQLLKFTRFGTFAAGQDNVELDMGTRMLVNTDQMLDGWIRWEDNRPVEQVMGLISEGFQLPDRDTLGHGYTPGGGRDEVDESEWESDPSGRKRDPWQHTYYMLMREVRDGKPVMDDDALYTFTTGSFGGRKAVELFCKDFAKWERARPDDFPVITLGWDQYEHEQFGWVKEPKFARGFITSADAKENRRVKLFDGANKTHWMPKTAFGNFGDAINSEAEDIPF